MWNDLIKNSLEFYKVSFILKLFSSSFFNQNIDFFNHFLLMMKNLSFNFLIYGCENLRELFLPYCKLHFLPLFSGWDKRKRVLIYLTLQFVTYIFIPLWSLCSLKHTLCKLSVKDEKLTDFWYLHLRSEKINKLTTKKFKTAADITLFQTLFHFTHHSLTRLS